MKKILITGADSFIGSSFERYVLNFSEEYSVDTLDMLSDGWRDTVFSDYDTVFHVAGIAHSDGGRISREREALYYSVNTELTIEVAKKAKAEGVTLRLTEYYGTALNGTSIGEDWAMDIPAGAMTLDFELAAQEIGTFELPMP